MPIEPRSKVIRFRVTPTEAAIIHAIARARGLRPSEWAREVVVAMAKIKEADAGQS